MAKYIGHYEILSELGSGYFGTVYLGEGDVPGKGSSGPRRRKVAIKKLRDPGDAHARETLRREFDLLAQVHHRSICKVYEFLDDDSAVVMEHVHGATLREVLDACVKSREHVFMEAVIEIGCEVADCLYQAYSTPGKGGDALQIVHRDIKPENVMITPQGEVKVLDFGLARVAGKLRDDKRVTGTPLYMAPEQALAKPVDHRTDLFALGLVLYEMWMERPAYRIPEPDPARGAAGLKDAIADVMRQIERADLVKQMKELEHRVPGPGAAVARCLQANPRARYENGHELMLDLRSHLLKDRGAYLNEILRLFLQEHPPARTSPGEPGTRRRREGPTWWVRTCRWKVRPRPRTSRNVESPPDAPASRRPSSRTLKVRRVPAGLPLPWVDRRDRGDPGREDRRDRRGRVGLPRADRRAPAQPPPRRRWHRDRVDRRCHRRRGPALRRRPRPDPAAAQTTGCRARRRRQKAGSRLRRPAKRPACCRCRPSRKRTRRAMTATRTR